MPKLTSYGDTNLSFGLKAEVALRSTEIVRETKLRVTFVYDGRIIATHGRLYDDEDQALRAAEQARAALATLGVPVEELPGVRP